jgi:hypothetical protein
MQPKWTGKIITLAIESPMHFGERLTGNLRQTRRYVPGRAIWGALTDRLTRLSGRVLPQDFERVGDIVHRALRFSYGFLSASPDKIDHWPWADREYFDWLHVQSYSSTSLRDGRSKEDGSLHETEFLAPRTRDGKQTNLLFSLWRDEAAFAAAGLADPLDERFWDGFAFGGERGYGWGRVRAAQQFLPSPSDLFGLWTVTDDFHVTATRQARILSHVLASAGPAISGPVEVVIGREARIRNGNGGYLETAVPGVQLSDALSMYSPGSEVACDQLTVQIGKYGMWVGLESRP